MNRQPDRADRSGENTQHRLIFGHLSASDLPGLNDKGLVADDGDHVWRWFLFHEWQAPFRPRASVTSCGHGDMQRQVVGATVVSQRGFRPRVDFLRR